MRIDQIRIRDMWSFGPNGVEVSGLPQHTVLMGKNNTGKSKILATLDWLKKSTDQMVHGDPFPIEAALLHEIDEDSKNARPEVELFVELDEPFGKGSQRVPKYQIVPSQRELMDIRAERFILEDGARVMSLN